MVPTVRLWSIQCIVTMMTKRIGFLILKIPSLSSYETQAGCAFLIRWSMITLDCYAVKKDWYDLTCDYHQGNNPQRVCYPGLLGLPRRPLWFGRRLGLVRHVLSYRLMMVVVAAAQHMLSVSRNFALGCSWYNSIRIDARAQKHIFISSFPNTTSGSPSSLRYSPASSWWVFASCGALRPSNDGRFVSA